MSTYSIAKVILRIKITLGQLRCFGNNLSRTSKKAEIYL